MQQPAQLMQFHACNYDADRGEALLSYRIDGQCFSERLHFVNAPPLNSARLAALRHVLGYLHIAAGISYYKALLPQRLELTTKPLSTHCAAFMRCFYRDGLAEFAWRNGLDLGDGAEFPVAADPLAAMQPPPLRRLTAVACGGGIGSAVTLAALREAGEPLVAVAVNCHPAAERMAKIAGVPLLCIERHIDPALAELNRHGAWNGHVPITGILSFAMVAAALIYDFDAIAMSNERSADEGNFSADTVAASDGRSTAGINHQWSKSSAFERPFRELLATELCPELEYASALRPFGELQVLRHFATAPQLQIYHRVVLSCNRAFRMQATSQHWCGNCDKCRFVFLGLAAFMEPHQLMDIFTANLLNQPEQRNGFRQLLGLGEHKPFDCVGTVAECRTALTLVLQRQDWADNSLLNSLATELAEHGIDTGVVDAVTTTDKQALAALPQRWRMALSSTGR